MLATSIAQERALAPVWRRGLLAGACALALAALFAPPAQAQFICDSVVPGGGDGATVSTVGDVACGTMAAASNGGSSAFGTLSTASGTFSSTYGVFSEASGTNSSAYGVNSTASGDSSVAIGDNALASANGSIAMGLNSSATGASSTAIGPNAAATHANAAAFGTGARTTRANQQVFGTSSNTYTMPGITSGASRAAQGSPTHIVTSNAKGDLAAYSFSELGLPTQDEMNEGLAAVASLAQPILLQGQTFAMRAGWGGYDDASAVSFTAAGVLAKNLLRPGFGSVVVDGGVGVGTDEGEVAGRAGLTFGW